MRRGLLGLCLSFVISCGGSTDGGDTPQGNPGGSAGKGGGGSGGGTGTGGAFGTGGSLGSGGSGGGTGGSGNTGGGGGPNLESVTLKLGPFTVRSGSDTYMCQNYANPFGGQDVDIAEIETHMTGGSHHLLVNYADGATSSGPTPCGGLEAPQGPFATQIPDDKLTYPEGIAAPLAGNQGIRINSHYFNTTQTPFEAEVTVILRRARPGSVRARAYTTMGLAFDINVQPHSYGSAGSTVSFSEDVHILSLMPHMHMHGTRFVVNAAGSQIFETDDWEVAPFPLEPPLPLRVGESLDYSCEYYNDGEVPLTFGEQAASNEMCILIAQYCRSSEF
jgi:hypothetical protein